MSELTIRIKKNPDGSATLSCTRADGSVTWQRAHGQQGRFFPLHDLTHYTVESVLGFGSGFFGLVAAGWDIQETGGQGARGPLPPEAITVEHIVGSLDAERAGGTTWTAAEFNAQAALFAATHGLAEPRMLMDTELERLRAVREELLARWRALPPGETLELSFTNERESP